MKTLLFSLSAIAALFLLAPTTGLAEPTHPNEVGLYATPDAYGATGTYEVWAPVDVYLVLTKPSERENGYSPVPAVGAFDMALYFNPIPNNDLFYMGVEFPCDALDLGPRKDINQGALDFYVGYAVFMPVMDESIVLATLQFFNMTTWQTTVTLGPSLYPDFPGQMAFLPESRVIQMMFSMGGSHEAPAFIFNGEAVAVENKSFGSVKALYR